MNRRWPILALMALLAFGCVHTQKVQERHIEPVAAPRPVPEIDRNIEEMRKVEMTLEQLTDQNRTLRQALGECMKKQTGATYVDPRSYDQIEKENQDRRDRIAFLKGEIEALVRERATSVQFYQEKGAR